MLKTNKINNAINDYYIEHESKGNKEKPLSIKKIALYEYTIFKWYNEQS